MTDNSYHAKYLYKALKVKMHYEGESLRHSLWHLLRQTSFQFGTWCWLTQTVRAHASEQASSSDTPQTVTQVSGMGSFENAPTFLSILLDVQTLSQTNMSSDVFSLPRALLILCSSARRFLILKACPATMAGIAAPKRDHHTSTIVATANEAPYLPLFYFCTVKWKNIS